MPYKKSIVVILGPTASGKSDLAVKIAKKFNGEVISADSRQVYKGLNIGSGKVEGKWRIANRKELFIYKNIPHHLLDITSPKRTFTVAKYQKLAKRAIQKIWKRKKLPILCGGTGFYIQAVIDGLVIPEVKPNQVLRKRLEKRTTEELYELLKKKDPARAKNIDKHNRRRLIRALEIIIKTGKTIPLIRANKSIVPEENILKIGIKREKEIIRKRIKNRLLKRLKQGMIVEVKKLHNGGLSWKRLEDFGLEYRYIAQFLQGKISEAEMIKTLEQEIWHYAKRQMTWFKRDERIRWIKNEKEAIKLTKEFLK